MKQPTETPNTKGQINVCTFLNNNYHSVSNRDDTDETMYVEDMLDMYAGTVRRHLRERGFVLIRGFPKRAKGSYLLAALGYTFPDRYLHANFKSPGSALVTIGGRQPRTMLDEYVFRSTSTPVKQTIVPHTELAYMGLSSPHVVGFNVIETGGKYCETPLIDMQGVLEEIRTKNPMLYEKLDYCKINMTYTFKLRNRKRDFFTDMLCRLIWGRKPKLFIDAFDAPDIDSAVVMAKKSGLDVNIVKESNMVHVSKRVSSIRYHPISNKPYLAWCGDFWGYAAASLDIDFYASRYSTPLRLWMKAMYRLRQWFVSIDPDSMRASCVTGTKVYSLTDDDILYIHKLFYDPRFYVRFDWVKDDFLIIDNCRFGHARAPLGSKKMTAMYGWIC